MKVLKCYREMRNRNINFQKNVICGRIIFVKKLRFLDKSRFVPTENGIFNTKTLPLSNPQTHQHTHSPTKIYSSLPNLANFFSTQIVAKGKNAEIRTKTKSSSSHLKIFFAGRISKR